MYRLIILEDEKHERDSLRNIIQTKFQDIFTVECAANANEAYALFDKGNVDVLISDISMPMMNGLDFIESIRDAYPQTLIYILTSYHYFQYGMRAMQLKVKDFLLKPIHQEVLIHCMNGALQELSAGKKEANLQKKMEDVRVLMEKDCIYALIENKEESMLRNLFMILELEPKAALALSAKNLEVIQDWAAASDCTFLQARYYDNQVGYLFFNDYPSAKQRSTLSKLCVLHKIAYGNLQCAFCDHYRSFEELQQRMFLHYYLEDEEAAEAYFKTMEEQLQYAVHKLDEKAIRKEEARFRAQIAPLDDALRNLRIQQCQHILNRVCGSQKNHLSESQLFDLIYQMIAMMKEHTQEDLILKDGFQDDQIAKALRYISMHYARNINLNDVATHLGLTPFYVSRMLKEKTGITFSEMVTNCRIRSAKKLLKEGETPIAQVAKQCGFLSQNYFTKVFRRMTGYTPKEYMINSRVKHEDIID